MERFIIDLIAIVNHVVDTVCVLLSERRYSHANDMPTPSGTTLSFE